MDINALLGALGPLQEQMRQGLAKTDDERAKASFDGTAGGGAVTIRLSGALTVQQVRIAPSAASAAAGDVAMLEDLVQAAITDALRQYRQRYGGSAEEQMQKLMGNANLGGLLGGLGGLRP